MLVRPPHPRDSELIISLMADSHGEVQVRGSNVGFASFLPLGQPLERVIPWVPATVQQLCGIQARLYVADYDGQVQGVIQISPVNTSRSTWQVDRIAIAPTQTSVSAASVGTHLIRSCLESCWEARTWVLQVDSLSRDAVALYRQNGFQPLAHLTTWELGAELLQRLAEHTPDLPNLLPVSNADAMLLYQLDTAAMPPQVRQVYDLGVQDFRSHLFTRMVRHAGLLLSQLQEVSGYVYEPQRKAAIAYFSLVLQRSREAKPAHHTCQVTVHPAYTWLYPEIMSQLARVASAHGSLGAIVLGSADYQPEREAFLEQIGATPIARGLLMARSVWHKVRESRPVLDATHLTRMLTGLQPSQRPVPGRIDHHPPTPNL
ncbi:MAG: GNAT family N-acetyltransferase [Oscillatoriales cyanobacterium SM2_2_1]|nr:GNAT family N-acetyltransferase [Oscillatoriales cyanobacterium SM2_2_1]